jgi:hypothetical protein
MDPNPELSKLAYQALEELVENFPPPRLSYGPEYDLIELPEGYEKPSKEAFEAKLQELIDAQPLKELRTKRNKLLEQTDRYATLDYPHSNLAVQQTWFDYRQALRDLPANTEDPANPVWPTAPTS